MRDGLNVAVGCGRMKTNNDMPILPNQRRPLHDDTPVLLPAVHRADAYREITEARRKLDDDRERQLSAGDTDRAPTAEGCQTCAMNLPGAITFSCPLCIARYIFANFTPQDWPVKAQQANAGQQYSILDDIMAEINRLDKLAQIALIKQSHKGEWA